MTALRRTHSPALQGLNSDQFSTKDSSLIALVYESVANVVSRTRHRVLLLKWVVRIFDQKSPELSVPGYFIDCRRRGIVPSAHLLEYQQSLTSSLERGAASIVAESPDAMQVDRFYFDNFLRKWIVNTISVKRNAPTRSDARSRRAVACRPRVVPRPSGCQP